MRALVLILVLALASAGAALADTGGATAATACPTSTTMGSCDELADACIANSIGCTCDQVRQLRAKGLTYADIAAAQAIASKAGKSINEVADAWAANKSWPDVAKSYNLSMSSVMQWPMAGSSDSETFNAMFISQYYGIPRPEATKLRSQGFSWDQIFLIANAAARTNQTTDQIACLRNQGMGWAEIAAKFNVSLSDLTCPLGARTSVAAGTAAGAGPTAPLVMYTATGNILLTEDQACCLYAEGNDWLDVAIAANMARETGYPITWFLSRFRNGVSWWKLIYDFNVSPEVAFCICSYPFAQKTAYPQGIETGRLAMIQKYQKSGMACGTTEYRSMVGRMPVTSPSAY